VLDAIIFYLRQSIFFEPKISEIKQGHILSYNHIVKWTSSIGVTILQKVVTRYSEFPVNQNSFIFPTDFFYLTTGSGLRANSGGRMAKNLGEDFVMKPGAQIMPRHLTADQVDHFRDAFKLFDSDGGGSIDAEELGACLRSLGKNLSEAEIHVGHLLALYNFVLNIFFLLIVIN
jgi:hypothetical protein